VLEGIHEFWQELYDRYKTLFQLRKREGYRVAKKVMQK
jgi:hypothetical protein